MTPHRLTTLALGDKGPVGAKFVRATHRAAIASFEQIGVAEKEAQAAKEYYDLVNEAYLVGEAALIEILDDE